MRKVNNTLEHIHEWGSLGIKKTRNLYLNHLSSTFQQMKERSFGIIKESENMPD